MEKNEDKEENEIKPESQIGWENIFVGLAIIGLGAVTFFMALSRPELIADALALGFIVLGIGYGSDFFKIKTPSNNWNFQPVLNTFGICVILFVALAWMLFIDGQDIECPIVVSRYC